MTLDYFQNIVPTTNSNETSELSTYILSRVNGGTETLRKYINFYKIKFNNAIKQF